MVESKQPRKQRKELFTKPLHKRKAELHIHISDELKAKLATKKRAMLVRKGDKVKISKGKFAGKTGKIASVDYKDYVVYVEGITVRNAKGQEKLVPLRPQTMVIVDGDFGTTDRKNILSR